MGAEVTPRALAAEAARRILADLADGAVSIGTADEAEAAVRAVIRACDRDNDRAARAQTRASDYHRASLVLSLAADVARGVPLHHSSEQMKFELAWIATWGDR
jgi:hypothetical protein